MDQDARRYQDQLHQANQERLSLFDRKLDLLLVAVAEVSTSTQCIPDMDRRIADLEAQSNQRKGANTMLGVIAGAVGAGAVKLIELFFHR